MSWACGGVPSQSIRSKTPAARRFSSRRLPDFPMRGLGNFRRATGNSRFGQDSVRDDRLGDWETKSKLPDQPRPAGDVVPKTCPDSPPRADVHLRFSAAGPAPERPNVRSIVRAGWLAPSRTPRGPLEWWERSYRFRAFRGRGAAHQPEMDSLHFLMAALRAPARLLRAVLAHWAAQCGSCRWRLVQQRRPLQFAAGA